MVTELESFFLKMFLIIFEAFRLTLAKKTIQICALYSSEHRPSPFQKQIFVELMKIATSSVEFSFNDIMHCQIDGVVMGSPLRPALANIFVGYYEFKLFQTTSKSEMYYRYMEDTSSVRKILERGGRKFENNKDQNENFSTQNQSGFPAQNQLKTKKKVFTQI